MNFKEIRDFILIVGLMAVVVFMAGVIVGVNVMGVCS